MSFEAMTRAAGSGEHKGSWMDNYYFGNCGFFQPALFLGASIQARGKTSSMFSLLAHHLPRQP